MATPAATTHNPTDLDDFTLDVSIVEHAPIVPDLMRSTDDGCGTTCASACSNSGCVVG
jgi:FxLD family lantipeptide